MLKNVDDHIVINYNKEGGYHPVFIVIVILLIQASIFINLRVESLYHTGNLYDTIIPRSNAPYGEHLHWTRAFDLILYAGAYVGSFFGGFNVALFWWSMFVNPILHICSFLVLFWGIRDLIGDARASLFGIIFPFQPEITSVFMPGIPDHHGALLFIFSLFIVLFIKSILNDNLKILSICGIVGGISLWFSIENIVIVLIAFSVLGIAWVIDGKPFQSKNIPISSFFVWHSFDRQKKVWIFITIVNISFIVWSALTYRMITYAFLCTLIPVSYLLYLPFAYIQNNVGQPYNALVRSVFIIGCCFGLLVLPGKIFSSSKQVPLLNDRKFLLQFSRYLNEDKFFKEEKRRTLTSMYMGPLILYKTPHEVIGTPSHRNVSGILDTYHVMNALNEGDAHVIIQRRGIQVIIIGRPESGIGDYFIQDDKAKNDMGEIFHHQLWKGNVPRWLQIYRVPKSLQGKIKVFLVLE